MSGPGSCSVVKHLRDLHGEVQALGSLEADVAQAAAGATATADVTASRHVQERLQGGGLAAAQGPRAGVTAPQSGQHALQRVAEKAGQEDRSTQVWDGEESW